MKQALINLLNTYSGLFYSAQSYRGLVYQKWSAIFIFFVAMHLISGAIATGTFTFRTIPATIKSAQEIIQITNNSLPEGLNISWNEQSNEMIFSESEYPIHLENTLYSDNTLFNAFQLALLAKNTFTIDPNSVDTETVQALYPDSFMIFTKNDIFFSSQSEYIGSIKYSEILSSTPSFTTTLTDILLKIENELESLHTTKTTYLPIISILVTLSVVAFSVSNLVLDTLFLILLVKLNAFTITVSQTVRLALLIGSVACLINQVATLLYPSVDWPFYSITFWLVAMYVLLLNRKMW